MADVVKTLKIKKPGAVGTVTPPDEVPDAMPAAQEEAQAQPQSNVILPRYAQVQPAAAPATKDSSSWTWVAIVATVAFVGMLALIAFQLLELKFYADPPTAWTHAGMF